ncbi:hypothetical protein F2Q69_00053958 [Brassica cretica]|uniref:Uncharacterized protein n=1 Tax=Brassica cretica TaxID=69181 RepID=A0A8S9N9V6_BRACR|nr:hypothetical protein F2Q69_00053958 [Brassica cretica]
MDHQGEKNRELNTKGLLAVLGAVLREREQAEIVVGQDANRLKLGLGGFAIGIRVFAEKIRVQAG